MSATQDSQPQLPVVDIAVTYLPNHNQSDKFTRFGSIATPAYFWLQRGDGDPITEVKIVEGDAQPQGDGWTKVDTELTKSDKPVFLWFHRGGDGSPVIDLKISTSDDVVVGPGFAKLDGELNPHAPKTAVREYFCYKTKASARPRFWIVVAIHLTLPRSSQG